MSFIALHGAIRGAAHKACGTMCQDAAISWVSEDGTVVVGAVADGHGDPICIRSDIGSGLAADVAIQSLRNLSGCSFEECRQTGGRVAEAIVSQWFGLVSEDLQNYPIGEDELEGLDANVINYWLRTSPTHLYGTTLVAFLVTPSMCFIVQQGDGCCAVLLPDGRIWNPVPPDDRCTGNVTTSLSDTDAVSRMRVCIIDLDEFPIAACYVASDGIEKSYRDDEGAGEFFKSLTVEIQNKEFSDICQIVRGALAEVSDAGSRDDASVAGLVDVALPTELVSKLAASARRYELTHQAEEARAKLVSMKRKHDLLKKRMIEGDEAAEGEYRQYHAQYKEWKKREQEAMRHLEAL